MLQAKKTFWGKRPGFDTGDILHVAVNLGFAAALYAMVVFWDLTPLAILLVVLSKWRVLAVQPRFWLPNVRANLVDLIVGISSVGLMHQTQYQLLALFWAALYGGWLLILKPRDHEILVGLQALWAQLLGLLIIFTIPSLVESTILATLLIWLVAWSCARHFFSNYEEPHYRLLSLAWSFVIVQLGWVGLHWLQYYFLFDLRIALVAVLPAIISASLGSIYHSQKNDSGRKGLVTENLLFAGALIVIILVTLPWASRP